MSPDEWGLLMEGPVVQTFATEHAARHYRKESAAFWGAKAPLVRRVEHRWELVHEPTEPTPDPTDRSE